MTVWGRRKIRSLVSAQGPRHTVRPSTAGPCPPGERQRVRTASGIIHGPSWVLGPIQPLPLGIMWSQALTARKALGCMKCAGSQARPHAHQLSATISVFLHFRICRSGASAPAPVLRQRRALWRCGPRLPVGCSPRCFPGTLVPQPQDAAPWERKPGSPGGQVTSGLCFGHDPAGACVGPAGLQEAPHRHAGTFRLGPCPPACTKLIFLTTCETYRKTQATVNPTRPWAGVPVSRRLSVGL